MELNLVTPNVRLVYHPRVRQSAVIVALLVLCACSGAFGNARSSNVLPSGGLPAFLPLTHFPRNHKIQHVVIIIQENRSFNNLFYGYPGALTKSHGLDSQRKEITLKPISLSQKWDMQHNGQGFIVSCDGTGKIAGTDCRMD
ncbi:MAG: hypothetical protein WAK19_02300, partial [Candidatus Cybelea sp.]